MARLAVEEEPGVLVRRMRRHRDRCASGRDVVALVGRRSDGLRVRGRSGRGGRDQVERARVGIDRRRVQAVAARVERERAPVERCAQRSRRAAGGTEDADLQRLPRADLASGRRRLDPRLRRRRAPSRVVGVEPASGPARSGQGSERVDGTQEERLQSHAGRVREHGLCQRGNPGHVRRRHRRPVLEAVRAPAPGRVDVRPGRAQVDAPSAVVREPGLAVELVGRADREDVGDVVAGRVVGRRVGVREVVACCGQEELSALVRLLDRGEHRLRELVAAPRVAEDRDALRPRVEDGADRVGRRPRPVGGEELERHDLRAPRDAGHPEAVVACGGDRSGDVRAVAVVVGRIVVAVHEVPPAPVVDVAVAVIVEAVRPAAGAVLARIDPDVLREVRMRDVDAGVDDGDHDVRAPGRDRPRFLRVDVRVGGARRVVHGLAGVVEAPQPR